MRILLAGDTHRNLRHTLWLIDQAADLRCASLFVLGDFAYRMDDGGQWFIQEVGDAAVDAGILVHWLDGNHDDHDWLDDVRGRRLHRRRRVSCLRACRRPLRPPRSPLDVGRARLRPSAGRTRSTSVTGSPMCRGGRKRRSPPPTSTGASTVDRSTCCSPTTPRRPPGRCSDGRTGRRYTDRPHTEANRRAVEQVRRATTPAWSPTATTICATRRFADGGRPLDSDTTDRDTTAGFSSTPATSTLQLFDHPYNTTILNERAVEIPVVMAWLYRGDPLGDVLEVGNVLQHYGDVLDVPTRRIVDRYETGPHVENLDVFDITGRYDTIITISTVEHVGWDPPEPARRVGPSKRSNTWPPCSPPPAACSSPSPPGGTSRWTTGWLTGQQQQPSRSATATDGY